VMRTLASGLARRGVGIDVATTDDNGVERIRVPLGQPVTEDGVTYRYFPRQVRFYTSSFPLAAWLYRHLGEYDLVHIHAVFSHASTTGAWLARRQGVPYIIRPLGILNRWAWKPPAAPQAAFIPALRAASARRGGRDSLHERARAKRSGTITLPGARRGDCPQSGSSGSERFAGALFRAPPRTGGTAGLPVSFPDRRKEGTGSALAGFCPAEDRVAAGGIGGGGQRPESLAVSLRTWPFAWESRIASSAGFSCGSRQVGRIGRGGRVCAAFVLGEFRRGRVEAMGAGCPW